MTNLPTVLYVCQTWSLTIREEHRLRMFENRTLRTILRPKRGKVMGAGEDCMRSSIVCALHQTLLVIKSRITLAKHVARMEEIRNAYKIFGFEA